MQLNKDGTIDIRVLSPEEHAFMRKHIALKFNVGETCPKISADLNVQLHYVERVCREVKLNGEQSVDLKKTKIFLAKSSTSCCEDMQIHCNTDKFSLTLF
ncbi:MAG: hypothetical protein LBD36_03015 [Holosporales bacterium]|jgi:hypothetical protein|nr:hypothetical protein [Holosporales bacterium]